MCFIRVSEFLFGHWTKRLRKINREPSDDQFVTSWKSIDNLMVPSIVQAPNESEWLLKKKNSTRNTIILDIRWHLSLFQRSHPISCPSWFQILRQINSGYLDWVATQITGNIGPILFVIFERYVRARASKKVVVLVVTTKRSIGRWIQTSGDSIELCSSSLRRAIASIHHLFRPPVCIKWCVVGKLSAVTTRV